jgi:N-acetylneuraminic acid mutarotase
MRERAVAFSINGKGYIGLGYNREANKEELGDFWQYDPDKDEWTQVADFKGTARYNAVGFAIGSKAYVGTGYDGDKYNSDFWVFDPAATDPANAWKEINSYPGEKIEGGLSFVIADKAYVCTGRNNGSYNLDFWQYNPTGDVAWTKLSPTDDDDYYDEFKVAVRRHDAMVLTIDEYAYIVGGVSSSGATDKTVYQFNSTTLAWDDRTSFEGSARSLAVAYVLNGRAYVGTGQNGSSRYDDVWEFKHKEEYDEDN